MKKILIGLVGLVALIIGAGVFLAFKGEELIAKGTTTYGSEALSVPVTLREVKLSPFTGQVALNGFTIGQPKGFGEGDLMALDGFMVKLEPKSLLSDHIKIEVIDLNGFTINAKMKDKKTNIAALKERLDAYSSDESSSAMKLSAKSILLRNMKASFQYEDGKVHEVALADIELKNLGVDQDGMPPKEMIRHALAALEPQIAKAAIKLGLKTELKKLEDKLPDEVKGLKDKAKSIFDSLNKKK